MDQEAARSSGDVRPGATSPPTTARPATHPAEHAAAGEITMKQFLDLLKTAYQVHDNIERHLLSKGLSDMVEWIKLKGVDDLDMKAAKKRSKVKAVAIDRLEQQLQQRVGAVIGEGVVDSVLPLLAADACPSCAPDQKVVPVSSVSSSSSGASSAATGDKLAVSNAVSVKRRTTSTTTTTTPTPAATSSEVEIHVCDEVKHVQKTFVCRQQLLVAQMGYFADVARQQRLEDMDISVHCDVEIFEWLMRWLEHAQQEDDAPPPLEAHNVVPILVSASFLRMDALIGACVTFCHAHLGDVVRASASGSLGALDDGALTRLAAAFSNADVEAVRDRRDRIQSKLYCKLIQSLCCDAQPEAARGHWASMARVFRCRHCRQLVQPQVGARVPCVASRMRVAFDGGVRHRHERDPAWDLSAHVVGLHRAARSWRAVYWRLWGTCHFLPCAACRAHFPARQATWCRHHPDAPQFFVLDAARPPLPVGRYPCCGERAYRFQVLDDRTGCQYRAHVVGGAPSARDAAVLAVLERMRALVAEDAPPLVFPDRLTRLIARAPSDPDDGKLETREAFWWDGLQIVPPRPALGALTQEAESAEEEEEDEEAEEEGEDASSGQEAASSCSSATSLSATSDSEQSGHAAPLRRGRRRGGRRARRARPAARARDKAHPKPPPPPPPPAPLRRRKRWQLNMSTRSNQDVQRANEEDSFKDIAAIVNERTQLSAEIESAKGACRTAAKLGGVWVRLEADFRERHQAAHRAKLAANSRTRTKSHRIA